MSRVTLDTTYADLRPTDLVIDKSGQAWPIDEEIETSLDGYFILFWLCDPMTKIRMHNLSKPVNDPVKVSRLPTQADEAAKLEAEFPISDEDAEWVKEVTGDDPREKSRAFGLRRRSRGRLDRSRRRAGSLFPHARRRGARSSILNTNVEAEASNAARGRRSQAIMRRGSCSARSASPDKIRSQPARHAPPRRPELVGCRCSDSR